MYADWSSPLSRPRRSWWHRDPRLLLAAVGVCVLALLLLAISATAGGPPRAHSLVVQRGDSLWSIAAAQYPDDDVRAQVEALEAANHLASAEITPGEELLLP